MIEPKLKKREAIAGMPNTPREFNIPITKAASDTSRMNGYMIRVRVTVSAALSGSNPGASTATSQGAESTPMRVIALNATAASVATLLASRQAEASFSRAAVRVNTVTKAVDSAPSANRSRSRFGMRNAMVNASMTRPPPNSAAKICSRARPSTRLQSTASPTTPAALVFSLSAREPAPAAAAGVSPSAMRRSRYHRRSQGASLVTVTLPGRRDAEGARTVGVLVLLHGRRARRIVGVRLSQSVVGHRVRVEQVVAEQCHQPVTQVHPGAHRSEARRRQRVGGRVVLGGVERVLQR